jgi:hypothetical protein
MADDGDGKDWETALLEASPELWELLEERREQPTISLAEMRQRLERLGPHSTPPDPPARSPKDRMGSP